MGFVLRVVRLLTMVVWVGGLVFFAFVVAPVAFGVLPNTHEAGMVVVGTLGALHTMGETCGGLFLLATGVLWSRAGTRGRGLLKVEMLLVAVMIAATVYVQRRIIPAMERDRAAAGGAIDAAAVDDPARVDFERLHGLSEKMEGVVLLIGVGVVGMMGAEGGASAVRAG
jgi:uncharacterized membrane protein